MVEVLKEIIKLRVHVARLGEGARILSNQAPSELASEVYTGIKEIEDRISSCLDAAALLVSDYNEEDSLDSASELLQPFLRLVNLYLPDYTPDELILRDSLTLIRIPLRGSILAQLKTLTTNKELR